jgi:hypothetical protein
MKSSLFSKSKGNSDKNNDKLSHFLLHASDEEKRKLFTEAANRANKDQRELVERSKNLQTA